MEYLATLLGIGTLCFIIWYFSVHPKTQTQYQHDDGTRTFNKQDYSNACRNKELGWSRKNVITKEAKKAAAKEKSQALLGIKIFSIATVVCIVLSFFF